MIQAQLLPPMRSYRLAPRNYRREHAGKQTIMAARLMGGVMPDAVPRTAKANGVGQHKIMEKAIGQRVP